MRGEDTYARMYASLCLNGHPAILAKYTYSTLLPAFLFGCVVYASATGPPKKIENQPRPLVWPSSVNFVNFLNLSHNPFKGRW